MVPGENRPAFEYANQARQVLNDAEDDLRDWTPELEDVGNSAGLIDDNLMPSSAGQIGGTSTTGAQGGRTDDGLSRITSGGSVTTGPTYAPSESEVAIH